MPTAEAHRAMIGVTSTPDHELKRSAQVRRCRVLMKPGNAGSWFRKAVEPLSGGHCTFAIVIASAPKALYRPHQIVGLPAVGMAAITLKNDDEAVDTATKLKARRVRGIRHIRNAVSIVFQLGLPLLARRRRRRGYLVVLSWYRPHRGQAAPHGFFGDLLRCRV